MPPLRLSILLPVYNGASVIAETIRTILAQGYENFEVILSDDCSTDDLSSVLRQFPDSRIRVFRNDRTLGYGANLERCRTLAAPDADVLLLLAQDDLLAAGYFATVNRVFHEHPEVGAITRPFYLFSGSAVDVPLRDFPPHDRAKDATLGLEDGLRALQTLFSTAVQLSGLAFRKQLVTLPFHPDTMPAHAYPFFGILRTHRVMCLKDYVVAVRRETSQTRHAPGIYDVSPTASWLRLVETVFQGPRYADLRLRCRRLLARNDLGLLQLKNYAGERAVLRELRVMVGADQGNLLRPAFWLFAIGTLITPRILLRPLVDRYTDRVAPRLLARRRIAFTPATALTVPAHAHTH